MLDISAGLRDLPVGTESFFPQIGKAIPAVERIAEFVSREPARSEADPRTLEILAGFLEHTAVEMGKLIDAREGLGHLITEEKRTA